MRRLQKDVGREKGGVEKNPENKWVGTGQVVFSPPPAGYGNIHYTVVIPRI